MTARARKKAAIKPAKAWTFTYGDQIMPEWMKSTKRLAQSSARYCSFPTQVIQVEIKPVQRKARP